jgi:SAM-dependent methyltransferase
MTRVSGTEGYAEEAERLIEPYESLALADVHESVLHLIPQAASRILDVGSGTGRDAGAFAAMGHRVVAVEPTHGLRSRAMALHGSSQIEWLDDSLPDLRLLRARNETFDLVMMTAVWMHLDEPQRRHAMPIVASLVRAEGLLILSLRHGPVPQGRRMFDVSADETLALAQAQDMHLVLHRHMPSIQRANRIAGVTWTRLAFRKIEASATGAPPTPTPFR